MALFTPALVTQAVDLLEDLNVEETTIRAIVQILTDSADDLHGKEPASVSTAVFGGSGSGAELGHHTSVAHQHVRDAMEAMVAGLTAYQLNVRRFRDDVEFTDQDAGDASNRTASQVSSMPLPSMDAASSCTAPTDFTQPEACAIPLTEVED